jgi:hypothetical protein
LDQPQGLEPVITAITTSNSINVNPVFRQFALGILAPFILAAVVLLLSYTLPAVSSANAISVSA